MYVCMYVCIYTYIYISYCLDFGRCMRTLKFSRLSSLVKPASQNRFSLWLELHRYEILASSFTIYSLGGVWWIRVGNCCEQNHECRGALDISQMCLSWKYLMVWPASYEKNGDCKIPTTTSLERVLILEYIKEIKRVNSLSTDLLW